MADLSTQQQLFVAEYLKDLNATQAAIRAGYSEKTAYSQGQRLLKHVEVAAALTAAQQARSERTKIDADWVLTRLAEEATADLADLYDDDGNLKPVKEWPLIWRQGLVAGIDVEELFEGRGEDRKQTGVVRKLRQSDRIKRIELIGKHVGVQAFKESVEHTGKNGAPLIPEDVSPRKIAKAMALILSKGLKDAGGSA